MSLTNQKIRVASEAISAAVQEDLFKQGYVWASVGQQVQYVGAKFLYAKESGKITYGEDEDFFESRDFVETVYTTQTKLVVVDKAPARTKVILFGKTYFKDELDAALATIKEARP